MVYDDYSLWGGVLHGMAQDKWTTPCHPRMALQSKGRAGLPAPVVVITILSIELGAVGEMCTECGGPAQSRGIWLTLGGIPESDREGARDT